jgi:hypothetical protein
MEFHRFLQSLLWSDGLELHHLTSLGILHMATFMTPCEAYVGIEPPLNSWSHFFWAHLQQGLDEGGASLGYLDISVCSGPDADSYFSVLQPDPPVE